jgi:hypothetical protein
MRKGREVHQWYKAEEQGSASVLRGGTVEKLYSPSPQSISTRDRIGIKAFISPKTWITLWRA